MTEQEFLLQLAPLELYLYRTALAITGSREDARDALQEALLCAFVSRDQLRNPESFKQWVKKIVIRQCGKILSGRNRVFLLAGDQEYLLEKAAEEKDYDEVLVRAVVEQLPLPLARVITLRYLADLSQKEIASLLHIPEGTVKSRLNRALQALREIMSEQKEAHDREMFRG